MKYIYSYTFPVMCGLLPVALFDYGLDRWETWAAIIILNVSAQMKFDFIGMEIKSTTQK